jgi:hypothetical protein
LGRDGTVADTVRYFRQISVTVYKLWLRRLFFSVALYSNLCFSHKCY